MIRYLSQKGWVPATSSNFSAKIQWSHISISRSGVDKSGLAEDDLIVIDFDGDVLFPKGEQFFKHLSTRPYTTILRTLTASSIHSVNGTLLSRAISKKSEYVAEDQWVRILKAMKFKKSFWGTRSHGRKKFFSLCFQVSDYGSIFTRPLFVFTIKCRPLVVLIVGHGLYTWGRSISESKDTLKHLSF